VVDGCPAIAYYDRISSSEDIFGLKYVRASTGTGASATDWGEPITVDDTSEITGRYPSMAVVYGNPAIAYWDSTNSDVRYVKATTSSGEGSADWQQLETVDDGTWTETGTLAIINSNPALSYCSDGRLKYAYYLP